MTVEAEVAAITHEEWEEIQRVLEQDHTVSSSEDPNSFPLTRTYLNGGRRGMRVHEPLTYEIALGLAKELVRGMERAKRETGNFGRPLNELIDEKEYLASVSPTDDELKAVEKRRRSSRKVRRDIGNGTAIVSHPRIVTPMMLYVLRAGRLASLALPLP